MARPTQQTLPFLSKQFKELGLLGRVAYVASALAAIGAAAITAYQIYAWVGNKMDNTERAELSQQVILLRIEGHLVQGRIQSGDTELDARYADIMEEVAKLQKRLD